MVPNISEKQSILIYFVSHSRFDIYVLPSILITVELVLTPHIYRGRALVGSLLNMARQAQGLATPHGVKQRSQRGRRGQIRPRSPEAPEHDPRIQPTPHLSESHRP